MADDSEIQESASEQLANGLKGTKVRGRELEFQDADKNLKVLLTLRGLNSSRRGLSVGRIERPSS
jgi:hypothetical protein